MTSQVRLALSVCACARAPACLCVHALQPNNRFVNMPVNGDGIRPVGSYEQCQHVAAHVAPVSCDTVETSLLFPSASCCLDPDFQCGLVSQVSDHGERQCVFVLNLSHVSGRPAAVL